MKIKNIEGLSAGDLQEEVRNGARFIYYAVTVSLLVFTFKQTSGVYLLRPRQNAVIKGIPYIIISALFGWWGFPFGPKYTLQSIRTNLRGGKNVTDDVMATVAGFMLLEEAQERKKNLSRQ